MFADKIKKLLLSFLGAYLESFPAEELQFKHWQGVVDKNYVKVKPEKIKSIFDSIGFPVVFVKGIVGKLQLIVPWTKLTKQPV